MNNEIHNNKLLQMALEGKLDVVKILIEKKGVDASHFSAGGSSALMEASYGGHLPVVKYLIEKHAVPTSTTDENGITRRALFVAALEGYMHIITYLVEKMGEGIMHELCHGISAVFPAAASGNAEVVRYFVDKNCSLRCTDSDLDPIHFAALCPADREDAIAYLIDECGCDPLRADSKGLNSLHMACQQGRINIVKYLVEKKNCDPLQAYTYEASPPHVACQYNNLHVVKYIVEERKMDPKQAQALVGHPCHTAAMKGCLRFVKYFIENGYCEVTDISNVGISLAQMSISGNHIEILKYLIEERGLDPKCIDYAGRTLLQYAQECGQKKCTN